MLKLIYMSIRTNVIIGNGTLYKILKIIRDFTHHSLSCMLRSNSTNFILLSGPTDKGSLSGLDIFFGIMFQSYETFNSYV